MSEGDCEGCGASWWNLRGESVRWELGKAATDRAHIVRTPCCEGGPRLPPAHPDKGPLAWHVIIDGNVARLEVHTDDFDRAVAWGHRLRDFIAKASGKPGDYRSDASPDGSEAKP